MGRLSARTLKMRHDGYRSAQQYGASLFGFGRPQKVPFSIPDTDHCSRCAGLAAACGEGPTHSQHAQGESHDVLAEGDLAERDEQERLDARIGTTRTSRPFLVDRAIRTRYQMLVPFDEE